MDSPPQKDPVAVANGKKGAIVKAENARRAKDAKVTREQEVLWVAANWTVPAENREPPSTSASNLIEWAQENEKNSAAFWSSMYVKVMQKEKREEEVGFTDDQRKFFRLFEALERERPDLVAAARKSHAPSGNAPLPRLEPVARAEGQVSASA